ncbi:MAG: csrA [Anaerocolumna sp.]|jgi:carbon storage regulator|nr:csrA [Anaerocolumna sp.]
MLALTRKKDEAIIINGNIEIRILDVQGDKVKLGISAPKEVTIYREELYAQIKESNQDATENSEKVLNTLKDLIK